MEHKIIDTNLLDLYLDKLRILVEYSQSNGQSFLSEQLSQAISGIEELIMEGV